MARPASRTIQFYLVLAVGILPPVVSALGVFLGLLHPQPATRYRLLFRIAFELTCILCLYAVLSYQHRRFRDIGFSFALRLNELWHALALFFVALFADVFAYRVLNSLIRISIGHGLTRANDRAWINGTTFGLLPVLFVLVNPFYEELLVRAFLITETEAIYRSTALAVCMSVALQASYHLFQGWPAALSHVPILLLFSWYFVRTRRILPVILAHMLLDATVIALYFRHLY